MTEKMIKEVEAVRKQWAAGDAERDKDVAPAKVREIKDILYCGNISDTDAAAHITDIYYPADSSEEKYPVIVSVHGGGWFYGDKELYSLYTKYLASKGFAVVNFNYRRSPECQYPAAFEDVCSLMNFIYNNAEKYSLDMNRLYMTGDSCGAQLAFQYSVYATSADYRRLFPDITDINSLNHPVPSKVSLCCGIYQTDPEADQMICNWYLPENMNPELSESIMNTLDYVNSNFPETYLMVSVNDPLKPRSDIMKKKLEENGVQFVYRQFGEDNEADGHVFHLNMRSENGKKCNAEQIEFFRK